jgi:hypothetical protein
MPVVAYFYDSQSLPSGAPSFSRGYSTGRLVAMTYGRGSAGEYFGYDALGRTLRKIQQTDAVNYLTEASYNVSGAMTSETYPSVPGVSDRRSVSYSFDSAGRLSSLNSNATTYAPAASVSSIGYAAHGALSSETYGNSLVHAATYNNRLQMTEIKLGTSGNPTSIISDIWLRHHRQQRQRSVGELRRWWLELHAELHLRRAQSAGDGAGRLKLGADKWL